MRHSEQKNMKCLAVILIILLSGPAVLAKGAVKDEHSTIYTKKVMRIVNALNVGDYKTQNEYVDMLSTACKRNQCSSAEVQGVQIVGQEIVLCRLKHLKAHGISNPDANAICGTSQAKLACDTIATPLLRKMCYTGNNYNLAELQKKESKMKNRMPASLKQGQ